MKILTRTAAAVLAAVTAAAVWAVPAAAAASLFARAGGYIDKVLPPDGKDGAHGL